MHREINSQTSSQQMETAAHKLFSEYIDAIRAGKRNELFALEGQSAKRRESAPDATRNANLLRSEVLLDIAFAEQAMHDRGNPYFALRENEIARDKLKQAERLEPWNESNRKLDSMLRTSFYDSTQLPEFEIYYPGGFPIDTGKYQNYHGVAPAPRLYE